MANPGDYNFELYRRVDSSFDVNLKDANDANINLTGKTIISQIWDIPRTKKLVDVAITIQNPASNGDITWKVTDTQSLALVDNQYAYDIKKIDANGDKELVITGIITVKEGYSEQ